jgi:hypothetical protein
MAGYHITGAQSLCVFTGSTLSGSYSLPRCVNQAHGAPYIAFGFSEIRSVCIEDRAVSSPSSLEHEVIPTVRAAAMTSQPAIFFVIFFIVFIVF